MNVFLFYCRNIGIKEVYSQQNGAEKNKQPSGRLGCFHCENHYSDVKITSASISFQVSPHVCRFHTLM